MSSIDDDTEAVAHAEDEDPAADWGAGALFGSYTVLAPGVQIVLDGRPVSAPSAD